VNIDLIFYLASSHRRHGQDKTALSCPCRRCEQAIRVQPWLHSLWHL